MLPYHESLFDVDSKAGFPSFIVNEFTLKLWPKSQGYADRTLKHTQSCTLILGDQRPGDDAHLFNITNSESRRSPPYGRPPTNFSKLLIILLVFSLLSIAWIMALAFALSRWLQKVSGKYSILIPLIEAQIILRPVLMNLLGGSMEYSVYVFSDLILLNQGCRQFHSGVRVGRNRRYSMHDQENGLVFVAFLQCYPIMDDAVGPTSSACSSWTPVSNSWSAGLSETSVSVVCPAVLVVVSLGALVSGKRGPMVPFLTRLLLDPDVVGCVPAEFLHIIIDPICPI
ncbi:hypothetical protein Tco_0126739 [Tanacetum coccineum]